MKSLDPYLFHTEKTRKENLFIPRATIPSKSTCKKIHAPDWLITSTKMQFGACPTYPIPQFSKLRALRKRFEG